jgi:hypothetical protein
MDSDFNDFPGNSALVLIQYLFVLGNLEKTQKGEL